MEKGIPFSILKFLLYEELFMEKMIDSLTQYSRLKLLFIFFAASQVWQLAIDNLIFFLDPVAYAEYPSYYIEQILSNHLIYSLIIFILVAPIIETLIFQILLLSTLKKLTEYLLNSDSWLPSLVLTSFTFAAAHGLEYGSLYYWFINASIRLPGSFLLALIAIIEYEKRNGCPILCVFLFHALYNAFDTTLILVWAE